MLYISTYIWNLERWYWWTSLQDSKEDADIEYRLADTLGEREGGTNWKSSIETYALPYVKLNSQWKFAVRLRELKKGFCIKPEGWDGERDGKELQEEGIMDVPMADSFWCLTEHNKIL